jgi:hypothetical protein
VAGDAAGQGLWPAAHEVHAALVAAWLATPVEVVIAVGPIYSADEWRVLQAATPAGLVALIEADVETTLSRARADGSRGRSRDPSFHRSAHARFRSLAPSIPADLRFDSDRLPAAAITAAIVAALATSGR